MFDDGRWFEVQAGFGRAIMCALAHLGGHPVAVVANQPNVLAGSIDAAAADKAAHFMSVADAFHLPIVFLSDNPGVLPGTASERAGILRAGGRMFAAQTLATHDQAARHVPQGVRVRLDGDGDESPFDHQTMSFAFPGRDARGDERHGQRHAPPRPTRTRRRSCARWSWRRRTRSASRLGFDELIDPRETRDRLLDALTLALGRRQEAPGPVSSSAITP